MSCFLFVIVFKIPLCHLPAHGINYFAGVDVISTLALWQHKTHIATTLQRTLSTTVCCVAKFAGFCLGGLVIWIV